MLPVCILFLKDGFDYLIPLIVYNNFMDDLDGIVAEKLNIRSDFGAALDNVCDAVAHSVLVLVVGMHYGHIAGVLSVVATGAMMLRVTQRLVPGTPKGGGSPTNELIRHIFFILVVSDVWSFDPEPILSAAFTLHAVSLLLPVRLPYLLRSLVKSATGVMLLNALLVAAWLVPDAAAAIGACFILTYLYSFLRAR